MWPTFWGVLGAVLLSAGQLSGQTHSWIVDVKANRDTLGGQDIRLEGEVVDVRSTSPSARRGFYRLADASDPTGVLVRTESIPIDGGSFRLRAKVAPDQAPDAPLMLDEVERDRVDGRPLLPVIAALASGLVFIILVVLLRLAAKAERQYAVAPPLWLLPDAGPYGKTANDATSTQPALKYEPELEEADVRQRDQLRRHKRSLFQALVGALAVTAAAGAWVMLTRPVQGQVPAFIFIDSNDPASRASRHPIASADTALTAAAATIPVNPPRVERPMPRVDPPKPQRPEPPRAERVDPPRQERTERVVPLPETRRPAIPVQPQRDPRPRDSVRIEPVLPPVVQPPPAPPPPAPSPPPSPPPAAAKVPDPAADRALAQGVIQDAAARLVAAINAKRSESVALLVPEALAGDLGRRERFLKLVRDYGPRASLQSVEEATMGEESGEARVLFMFTWRGDFGIEKKKSGRLVAFVRRDGETWRFEGARLLDPLP